MLDIKNIPLTSQHTAYPTKANEQVNGKNDQKAQYQK